MTIAPKHIRTIEEHAAKIAQDFQVKGILNVQFAICNDEVYIIEANPRASRTVPIVSKVTGISWRATPRKSCWARNSRSWA